MTPANPPVIEPPLAVAAGERANPARGRPVCRVVLDLRVRGLAGAVAVDRRGALRAWALVGGALEPGQLIELALARLAVRPGDLRVLLGSRVAQVAPVSTVGTPSANDVRETLEQEGYSPGEGALAHGAVHCGGASWLAAACVDDELAAICKALKARTETGPQFVVDQLFIAANLEPGSAAVEKTSTGFSVIVVGQDGAPLARSLSPAQSKSLSREVHRLLVFAGLERAGVEFLGEDRASAAAAFGSDDQVAPARTLPGLDQKPLPEQLELAWRVAVDPAPPALDSPFQHEVRRRVVWAQRASALGILLALGGIAVAALGYDELLAQDARLAIVAERHSGLEKRLQKLGDLGEIARSAAGMAQLLQSQSQRWPAVLPSLDALARSRPERVGWEKLTVDDAKIELRVSASGPDPARELDAVSRSFLDCPGVGNVSRGAASVDARGLGTTQTFRAEYVLPRPAGGAK